VVLQLLLNLGNLVSGLVQGCIWLDEIVRSCQQQMRTPRQERSRGTRICSPRSGLCDKVFISTPTEFSYW